MKCLDHTPSRKQLLKFAMQIYRCLMLRTTFVRVVIDVDKLVLLLYFIWMPWFAASVISTSHHLEERLLLVKLWAVEMCKGYAKK